MSEVAIAGATKRFSAITAVDDVTLTIQEGELFFLLGPSGCGKTTLLRILAGFYFPDAGSVHFGERDVTAVEPHRRNTGMVFQNYALWPHMTVAQNLEFGLEMHAVPADERSLRVRHALETVQIADHSDRYPNQLSGGQQQRVALGRALVLQPEIVLLDEPLANLDAKLRLDMRAHIKRIHAETGTTMIYVTHDQDEALSMADRVSVMMDGRIVQTGTPREVYMQPVNTRVASFIGKTNLLRGRVVAGGARPTIETSLGGVYAACDREVGAGQELHCSIRPERLSLAATSDGSHVFRGRVAEIVYLGDHEQYLVDVADGVQLTVVEFDVRSSRAAVGDDVVLAYDPRDVVLLEE